MAADQDPETAFRTFPSAIEWSIPLADGAIGPPVIAGDLVVVSLQSAVVARRLRDGSDAWTAKLTAVAPLVADDGIVLVAAEDAVRALEADDGAIRWTSQLERVSVPPLLRGGWAILAAGDVLTAIRAADGSVVWSRKIGAVSQQPAIDGDVLYTPLADGRLLGVDLTSGEQIWERTVGAIQTPPLLYRDRVYFGAAKHLVCLKTNGDDCWSFPVGAAIVGSVAADDSRVYAASMDNLLRAFSRGSGAQEWKQNLGYRPAGGPILTGTAVAVPGRSPTIPAFDVARGKPVAQLVLPSQAVSSPALIPPGHGKPGRLAVVTTEVGKPWLLVVAAEAPPAPPAVRLTPFSVLPGTSVPVPKPPL